MGDVSAFALLDKNDLFKLFYYRRRPFKIINPPDEQGIYSPRDLRLINDCFSQLMHNSIVNIGQTPISVYDFEVYVDTLHWVLQNLPEESREIREAFLTCFPFFGEGYKEIRKNSIGEVGRNVELLDILFSDFTRRVVRIVPEERRKSQSSPDVTACYNNLIIRHKASESELVTINGHSRTVYRILLIGQEQISPMEISAERLGITGIMKNFKINVFIQQHALRRIKERLCDYFLHLNHTYIVNAILSDAIPADDEHGFLFPLKYGEVKLGYLKAVLIGDKLIILTFLFLTNNGTPEGKKLHDLIGIQKQDKKYLGIDKLSTFILSDIKQNMLLKDLFCHAGCNGLFELPLDLLDKGSQKEIACASYITHYLGVDETISSPHFFESSLPPV